MIKQIRNQDDIIKTLKSRLEAAEKQDENMVKIVNTLKMNDRTRKDELVETRQILQDSLAKSRELEKKTLFQIKQVENADKYAEGLKLKLHEKDQIINDLKIKMNLGEETERNKHLEDKLALCSRERDTVYKANKVLEENLEALNAAKLVETYFFAKIQIISSLNQMFQLLQDSSLAAVNQTSSQLEMARRELREQDNLIVLIKKEIVSQKQYTLNIFSFYEKYCLCSFTNIFKEIKKYF